MEAIFHEQQEGSLCAQHCLNSLLQGQFYSAVDLAELATELDDMERVRMAEMGEENPEYQRFIQQASSNMDDSGFFSVQVITRALSVWGLDLLPLNSSNPEAVRAKSSAISATAYICNYREHWFTIRRLGSQWFNLNSLLEGPELVSNTYLGEFLAQLQQEGYDIFLVTGQLPECDADLVLQAVSAVQAVPPRLLSDVSSSGMGKKSSAGRQMTWGAQGQSGRSRGAETGTSSSAAMDEAAELEAAMLMSLAETSGADGGPAQLDSQELERVMAMQREGGWGPQEDDDMQTAIRLSQQQPLATASNVSEEDEIQQAIALSLEGGGHSVQSTSNLTSEAEGWGQRMRQQQVEEEERYLQEQERTAAEEEEQLRKALAMSMESEGVSESSTFQQTASASKDEDQAKNATQPINPVKTAWPKIKNPEPGTIASPAPKKVDPSVVPISPSTSTATSLEKKMSTVPPTPGPVMPDGPGHKLGGSGTSNRRGKSGSNPQAPSDDPQEIRRRRLAFLDKLQKNPPANEEKK